MMLEKYSFGTGDRFGHQGRAQLGAIIEAKKSGVDITPVWNKSNREHMTIHTVPLDTRKAADAINAFNAYSKEIQDGRFPDDNHSYHMKKGELEKLLNSI